MSSIVNLLSFLLFLNTFYNVVMLNPVTGQTYKMGQDEAGAMFENTGNKFIAIK